MTNNDIFKRLRYILDYRDAKMIEVFAMANQKVKRAEVSDWLKKPDDELYRDMDDRMLAIFLNGLIIDKRGKREGLMPKLDDDLDNNIVLKKVKIAFNLKTDEIVELFDLIGKKISPHELSAFLRDPEKSQYRDCNDQYLRYFLSGLQKKIRG